MFWKLSFRNYKLLGLAVFTKICLDFGTNSIMKTIDLSCLLSQNYLKKLVSPKFRVIIDGLSLTSEGYTRPKFILVSKYRKFSKVANAHIQNLMSLPHINSANLYKKDEFTEKLLGIVKALTIIDKLWLLGWYVRLTWDKLKGKRAYLVRVDNEWQEWKFPQLVEVLESWTRKNPITLTEKKIQISFKAK